MFDLQRDCSEIAAPIVESPAQRIALASSPFLPSFLPPPPKVAVLLILLLCVIKRLSANNKGGIYIQFLFRPLCRSLLELLPLIKKSKIKPHIRKGCF